MIYPLHLAADGVPVAGTCRALRFSKQDYFRWRAGQVTERDWAVGSRFITDERPGKCLAAGENTGFRR